MLPIWIYFIFVEIRNLNSMKLIQVNPKGGNQQSILSALNKKELSLRNKQTTFYKEGKKWKHKNYDGWITFTNSSGDILFAKVQSKVKPEEQKLLEAFIGYLTRHLTNMMDSLTIYYR